MKVIPLSKAKARLAYYSKICKREQVIVTVKGVPAFQIIPVDEDDDLIDRLIGTNPKFRKLLEKSLASKGLPAAAAMAQLK